MEKIVSEFITQEKIQQKAQELLASASEKIPKVPESAQQKVDEFTCKIKESKPVSDLMVDIEEKPEKVKREAAIASACAVAVFCALRVHDTMSAKKQQKESSLMEAAPSEPENHLFSE